MSSLVVNPKNAPYNAKGDGTTNDTVALQKAVDAVGGTGGTLLVPAGTYMIDASTHLLLKANMTLSLAPGATLKAIPNGLEGYAVILVNGVDHVNIVGGVLEGERDNHTGTTGEWGMGLKINNAQHVVVEGVTAKECWGDGFYVGGASSADVTFCNVIADHNRRQGMSVTSVDGLVVRDSVFKNTAGTLPESGLDIEPNRGETVTNALVAQCTFTNNAGGGLRVGPAGVEHGRDVRDEHGRRKEHLSRQRSRRRFAHPSEPRNPTVLLHRQHHPRQPSRGQFRGRHQRALHHWLGRHG